MFKISDFREMFRLRKGAGSGHDGSTEFGDSTMPPSATGTQLPPTIEGKVAAAAADVSRNSSNASRKRPSFSRAAAQAAAEVHAPRPPAPRQDGRVYSENDKLTAQISQLEANVKMREEIYKSRFESAHIIYRRSTRAASSLLI